MREFEEFLDRLFREGEVVFQAPPRPNPEGTPEVARRLTEAYESYRLDIAGPPIPFHIDVARKAGELVRQACWGMVSRGDRAEDLAARLVMERPPKDPADHLSADLLFRYLPRIFRRARGASPGDPLVALLADVLRRWPLSGVLAGLDDPPLTSLELGGHPGLLLLYNERFVASGRPSWEPVGAGRESLDLVRYCVVRPAAPEGRSRDDG
jgi:hypothetical protein